MNDESMHDLARDVRLLRLQIDNLAPRMSSIEQAFHGLLGEVSRGFSQAQQQIARLDLRFDSIGASIQALRGEVRTYSDDVMRAVRQGVSK